ncbi:MAG TPA: TolC family protein, partial [Phototrophicaceae bacterium]|nr:TolC family protein [Phototrophicaceae bacterium]
ITLNFAQPLLRNFRIDATRANVKVNEINQTIVNSQVQQQIESTTRTTRLAYLQLISAIQGLAVAQQNLEVSNASLRNNKARVEVGVSAPADLVSAEAQVASYEEGVIVAKSSIESAMDQLRQLILDPVRPDYWTVRLQPADAVTVQPPSIDVEAAVQNALKNRMDLEQARQSLKANDINVKLARNQALPSVDFSVSYSALGKAGTALEYDNSQLPPVVISSTSRSFTGALHDAFTNAYPSWTYGVSVGYPIGNTANRVASARAEVAKRQAEVNLAALQQEIATEVRAAARQVDTNYKRILTTRAALDAQEKQLEAEQKRFDVGLSDNFKLFQFQRDVAAARVQALNAELSYSQALILFEAVQRIR